MAKDVAQPMRLEDLSDGEIARIEAALFCAGGPPRQISEALLWRASHPESGKRPGVRPT